jgi:hypothetical protein
MKKTKVIDIRDYRYKKELEKREAALKRLLKNAEKLSW